MILEYVKQKVLQSDFRSWIVERVDKEAQIVAGVQRMFGLRHAPVRPVANGQESQETISPQQISQNSPVAAAKLRQTSPKSVAADAPSSTVGDNSSSSDSDDDDDQKSSSSQPKLQFVSNTFIHLFMYLLSVFGEEGFFAVIFPALFWQVDVVLSRRLVVTWLLCVFLGQAAKDIFACPRPRDKKVVQCDLSTSAEYGFPSTHAQCTCVMFLFAIDYLHHTYGLPSQYYGYALIFSLLVSLSRLYFGVHSVVDLLGGYALGFAQLFFTWYFDAARIVDELLVRTHGANLLLLISASTSVLVALYPYDRQRYSPSWGNMCRAVGAGMGAVLACSLTYGAAQHDPTALPLQYQWPQYGLVWPWVRGFLRIVLGVVVIGVIKLVSKPICWALAPWLVRGLGIAPAYLPKDSKIPHRERYEVEIPAVFATYFLMGWLGCSGDVWFDYVGLGL